MSDDCPASQPCTQSAPASSAAILPSNAVIVTETVAPDKRGENFTIGLAAGLTLGVISSLVLIGFIVALLVRLRRKKSQLQNTNADRAMDSITNITYEGVLSDSVNSPASVEPVDYMRPASVVASDNNTETNFTAIVRGRVVSASECRL